MLACVQIEPTVAMQVTRMNFHGKVQCFRGCNSQFSDMQELLITSKQLSQDPVDSNSNPVPIGTLLILRSEIR